MHCAINAYCHDMDTQPGNQWCAAPAVRQLGKAFSVRHRNGQNGIGRHLLQRQQLAQGLAHQLVSTLDFDGLRLPFLASTISGL